MAVHPFRLYSNVLLRSLASQFRPTLRPKILRIPLNKERGRGQKELNLRRGNFIKLRYLGINHQAAKQSRNIRATTQVIILPPVILDLRVLSAPSTPHKQGLSENFSGLRNRLLLMCLNRSLLYNTDNIASTIARLNVCR